MTRLPLRAALVVWCAALFTTTPLAHHSFAMYDTTKPQTLRGRVVTFRWINPHAVFTVATESDGATWAIELSSPSNMTRLGWTRTTLTAGDRVDVSISPMRDKSKGGACRQLALLDKSVKLECGAGTAIRAGEKVN
jgi:Family of unknown function (DUF6152)